jgi:hypothetical protein
MAVAAPPLGGEVLRVVGNKERPIKRSASRRTIQKGAPKGAFKSEGDTLPRSSDIAHVKTVGLVYTLHLALGDAEGGRESRGSFAVVTT